jgi:hypothetical protein
MTGNSHHGIQALSPRQLSDRAGWRALILFTVVAAVMTAARPIWTWVFNLMACFIIMDRVRQCPGSLVRLPALVCPVLWVGMRLLEQHGLLSGSGLWTARLLGAALLGLSVAAVPGAGRRSGPPLGA